MSTFISGLLLFMGLACSTTHVSPQLNHPTFFKNNLAGLPDNPNGKIWALLVAGSEGWGNYRHQADLCHAYQILHSNGIPDENIIVMMPDDIAFDERNPTPGIIINHPGGPDVYEGVLKDYTGKDVNVKNFLNILLGNKTAMKGIGSGKVIESGPDDLLFINFVDHGAEGVLFFPNGEELFADKFLETLNLMNAGSKYSKLILYIEACHAGSMFDNMLPDTTNVFALTASDPHENSFACYYDEQRETYLGDVFSVIWMNDTEHESLQLESIHHQFQYVRTYTNTSHVEEYGDLDIGVTKLKDVLGFQMRMRSLSLPYSMTAKPQHPMDTADNIDVPLIILQKKISATEDPAKSRALMSEIYHLTKRREIVDELFDEIINRITNSISELNKHVRTSKYGLTLYNFLCYRRLYTTFSNYCISFIWNPYARTHLQKFVNICSSKWLNVDKAIEDMKAACSHILGSVKLKGVI